MDILITIAFVGILIFVAVEVHHNKHQEEQRKMEIKAEQLRREAERKRAEERAEEERKRKKEEQERVWEEARRAEEAKKAVFKNSKCVQEIVQEMSEFFIQGIQDAKRDISVVTIDVQFEFYVYKGHLKYCIHYKDHLERYINDVTNNVTKEIYFQSYGLRNLNPGDNEILNMSEVIKDLLIPKIRNAMPFDKDIGAKVISKGPFDCTYDDYSFYVEYTATNGNFSHKDW